MDDLDTIRENRIDKRDELISSARACLESPLFIKYRKLCEEDRADVIKKIVEDEFEISITGLEKINKYKTELNILDKLLKQVTTEAREK